MKTDPILEIVLGLDKQPETSLGPSPEPDGIVGRLRNLSLYGCDTSPHVEPTPAPAKKRASITEVEKDLKALGRQTGNDFRRLLGKHASALRADVKSLVQSHREEIIAHVKDADNEK